MKMMKLIHTVTNVNIKCEACGCPIDEANWYIRVYANAVRYFIHDNNVCIEVLKYKLGLPYNRFYTSISPGN